MAKGDLVWFNPALMHAAGTNVSAGIQRMANLLQVSSAFGRAMESVDRERVVNAIYPALLAPSRPVCRAPTSESRVADTRTINGRPKRLVARSNHPRSGPLIV
ncbi:MAG: phytanoyl-CoA dioxygenase family protein [Tetrasphaera sp.]